jgi:hypothetical protein
MKKLHLFATAAALLVAASAPSLAATRTHHNAGAYSARDSVGVDRDYSERGYNAYGAAPGGAAYSGNLPYSDRPYGDPDSW